MTSASTASSIKGLNKSYGHGYKNFADVKKAVKSFLRSRWTKGVVYIFICANILAYNGWAHFQIFLYKAGMYEWRCQSGDAIMAGLEALNVCEKQYDAVKSLFTLAQSAELGFTVLAGISLDHLGPLVTSMIGNTMLITAWLMIMYSSKSFSGGPAAMILMGGSVNMLAFPCLELEYLFPEWKQLALAVIIAAQMVGTAVPLVLRAVLDHNTSLTAHNVFWGYMGIVILPSLILSALIHPLHRNSYSLSFESHFSESLDNKDTSRSMSNNLEHQSPQQMMIDQQKDDAYLRIKKVSYKTACQGFFRSIHLEIRTALKSVICVKYILFSLVYFIEIVAHGYYQPMMRENFPPSVADFQGNIMPSQGILGIAIGAMTDYIGSLWSFQFISGLFLVSAVTAIPKLHMTSQYVSVVIYTLANSYIYTAKYAYIAEYFKAKSFGFLVGLLGTLSGLFNLVNILFSGYVSPEDMLICFGVAIGFCMLLIAYLQYLHRKLSPSKTTTKELFDLEDPVLMTK